MITYRDFLVDEYRRQDKMTNAEHRRLLQSVLKANVQGRGRLERTMGWAGRKLMLLGERLQTLDSRQEPTFFVG